MLITPLCRRHFAAIRAAKLRRLAAFFAPIYYAMITPRYCVFCITRLS